MKYLKTYEDVFTEEVYWRIEPKSEGYILASLKKIEVNIELYNSVKDKEIKFMLENNRPIYVARGYDKGDKINWFFYSYGYDEFKKDKMKFMGKVKPEKWEVNAYKYNL